MKTFDKIKLLVVSELEQISDPLARDGLETVLIEPRQTLLIWDYGEPGETYPGWMVAEDHETNTGIAWCDQGFGPKNPWGLMSLTDAHMGMD